MAVLAGRGWLFHVSIQPWVPISAEPSCPLSTSFQWGLTALGPRRSEQGRAQGL